MSSQPGGRTEDADTPILLGAVAVAFGVLKFNVLGATAITWLLQHHVLQPAHGALIPLTPAVGLGVPQLVFTGSALLLAALVGVQRRRRRRRWPSSRS